MKFIKRLGISVITATIAFSSIQTKLVYAVSKFKDVKETFWAYNSISFVSSKGYIVGDSLGNFKPNDFIDKFETVKILSRVSGYNYNNPTEDEIALYKKIYEKNISFISQFDSAFKKWNSTADKEIAYLLEKEILVSEDLNQFVLKTQEDVEKLRALSREEVAMFVVKLIGHKQEALSLNQTELFKDDTNISETTKPYVYYLKEKGVISGDDEGKFNPKTPVTRAVMATILDRALALDNKENLINTDDTVIDSNISSNRLETLTGKVDKYFPTLTALQIVSGDGKKNIYKLAKSNTIYIDGFIKKADDLTVGMSFVAVLNNSEIVDIKAQSVTTATEVEPITNIQKSTLEGTISNKSEDYISIQIKILSPKGDITKEVRTYKIDKELQLTKGNESVELSEINVGDIVNAIVSTTTIYEINVDEVDLKVSGTLLEKKYEDEPVLVIKTKDGLQYSLTVTKDSIIARKGSGEIKYTQLRVGDTLDIQAKYNKITDIYAYGTKTTVEGTIEEIYIGATTSKITIKSADGTLTSYNTVPDVVDVYSLKLGSKVKIHLDSLEVESISIVSVPVASFLTGTVSENKNNTILLFLNDIETRTIIFNKDTVFLDSFTGNRIESSFLTKDMKIYVVLQEGKLNTAKTITILNK